MRHFIGLMSGTSLDGIDAALVRFDGDDAELVATHEEALPTVLRNELLALCQNGENEIERLGRADRTLAATFAEAVKALLAKTSLQASDICAIGSHGQTIRHHPYLQGESFSLQIGDPHSIAEHTGIDVVADFRRRDIAAGGQGAPLVPPFHAAVFGEHQHHRVIVNIGGIANISVLEGRQLHCGFDTGPGNGLMDAWIQQQQGKRYDNNGDWAQSGHTQAALLQQWLSHPYLAQAQPKSTGREDFNIHWLEESLTQASRQYAPEDVQASLLEFTAQTISTAIHDLDITTNEIYLCGGGAYNGALCARIEALLHPKHCASTEALGIHPAWVEAAAFAWLAKQRVDGLPGNGGSATGAKGPRILGSLICGSPPE